MLIPDEALSKVDVGSCFIQSAMPGHLYDSFSAKRLVMIFLCLILVPGVFRRLWKSFPAVCILLASLVLIVPSSHAGYLTVGGGAGGDADEFNLDLSFFPEHEPGHDVRMVFHFSC